MVTFKMRQIELVKLYCSLIFTAIILIWVNQTSVNAFWLQTFHQNSPFEKLDNFKIWQLPNIIKDKIRGQNAEQNEIKKPLEEKILEVKEPEIVTTSEIIDEEIIDNNIIAPAIIEIPEFLLSEGDKVLLAGDSLMQGVAPHISRYLKQKYNLQTINLSKHSTGLSYPSFFNWPETIKSTLISDSDIKLLMVMIGANDPWDFKSPYKRGVNLRFKSQEWSDEYKIRIASIINSAKDNNVNVIWVGMPYMQKQSYNDKIQYLNQIMEEEILNHQNNAKWLPIANLLAPTPNIYQNNIMIDGKNIIVRSKDGIHFSIKGQQFIADAILKEIKLN